ncbi:MAG: glycosyltransferase family 4 protein [Planctomycetota bacterium]|nr:glycosyltransferase family 4 protein [Planctomycetota bacterium]
MRQFASERMGLPEHKLVDIPNGVEPRKIDPVPDDSVPREWFSDELPTVLFLGRLEPQKGLIPFFKALRDQANLPPFRLLLVGEGSQQTRLQSMARSLKQEVIFAGWAESPHRLIAKSKVVILPSLWEGMPNALLETMAVGRPFVAFGVDGVREIALPDTLQAVEAGDYRSFFERLSQVIGSQKLASDLGNQNRQHVETNFSIKKMIAKYEAVYLDDSSSPAC